MRPRPSAAATNLPLAALALALTLGLMTAACSAAPEETITVEPTPSDELVSAPQAKEPEAPAAAEAPPPPPEKPQAGTPPGPTPVTGPTPADFLAKLRACKAVSTSPYKTDATSSAPANVSVCGTAGGVHFAADMDIDCDGKTSTVCNRTVDPSFQARTAGVDSTGAPLDAAKVPYIVVPGESSRFAYSDAGISMGSVAAVFYGGKMVIGVVGDVGPSTIVGEASYAMAQELGINPNPATGGVASGVTYLVLSGPTAKVRRLEDRAEVQRVGEAALAAWYAKN